VNYAAGCKEATEREDFCAKPFPVTKQQVWEAWKRVKANQGGAGIDQQSIADFEENLADNLYKIWNRAVIILRRFVV